MKKSVDVVGAVLVVHGRILCTQRGSGALAGMWEFPGGKIEAGETPQDALAREIREELGCLVTVGNHVDTSTYDYDFATVTLSTYYCTLESGEPSLTEHSDARWLLPDELHGLEWAPADLPAVAKIQADFA